MHRWSRLFRGGGRRALLYVENFANGNELGCLITMALGERPNNLMHRLSAAVPSCHHPLLLQSYWAVSRAKKGYSGVVTYASERWGALSADVDCLGSGESDIDREGGRLRGGDSSSSGCQAIEHGHE